ncbi:MAG: type VI secretion system baseplate subunit TssK, partial [Deltaproteobacteria bacterium]|nr:type VI secretion system baseplate subunit TssK [Deltaproteobacteria bacterium]
MIDARDLPEAIQWHEGMLLAPQHFQQLSLRSEELLNYFTMMFNPFYWGVRRIRVDESLLIDGT